MLTNEFMDLVGKREIVENRNCGALQAVLLVEPLERFLHRLPIAGAP